MAFLCGSYCSQPSIIDRDLDDNNKSNEIYVAEEGNNNVGIPPTMAEY